MGLGALGMLAGAALALLLTANFVEWPNAPDALATIAALTAPVMAVGTLVLLAGRRLHGDWRTGRPLRTALPWLLRLGGGATALVYGAMLLNVLLRGFGPEDYAAASKLALAASLGAAGVWAGGRIIRGRLGASVR
jgi:hypothetical protein